MSEASHHVEMEKAAADSMLSVPGSSIHVDGSTRKMLATAPSGKDLQSQTLHLPRENEWAGDIT